MEHTHFDVERDGFYGAYWLCPSGASCALIAMLGDDPEDHMARSAVKWLLRRGVNVLTMSPAQEGLQPPQLPPGAHRGRHRLAQGPRKPEGGHCRGVHHRHPGPDGGVDVPGR